MNRIRRETDTRYLLSEVIQFFFPKQNFRDAKMLQLAAFVVSFMISNALGGIFFRNGIRDTSGLCSMEFLQGEYIVDVI